MDYRKILESRYDRKDWQDLLHDIFHQKVQFWQQPQQVPVDKTTAKQALYMGKITLSDGNILAVYEVELSDNISIKRNRAGIRNLLCPNWKGMGCVGAFMFCFRKNEAVLRFSYVSESFAFAEDGSLKKESTDTKRFTYLLGKGHRSRTAIKQFEELKKSTLDLKAITKAFSVEALSDAFFNEYKKQYEDIVEFITGKRMVKVSNKWEEEVTGKPCEEIMQEFRQFQDAEKAIRDYVKKLMGRLVFIQFLQKKGWMGCPEGEAWNGGDKEFVQNLFANTTNKDSFVDDVLEPLFNDINTKRTGDLSSCPNVGVGIKIPYLNGGLFEKDSHDNISFPLPAKFMKSMLDFFASYNFTIDENDPDDAEIGVDPEMLGRIFENLLEDNKDKGAFYTPKEIVLYMCRESLIAYLQTDITDETTKESIRQFITSHDASVLSEERKEYIDQKLIDVKICDPAIGSGAFPMGLLRELYACRKSIEGIDDESAVNIKSHIIQNNIYGVDIESGAVEIARLRFWLALVVDENSPRTLPNLDFKIMQGNSLLEQYKVVDLSRIMESKTIKSGPIQMTFLENNIDELRRQLIALRRNYFNTVDKQQKHSLRISMRNIVQQQIDYIVNNFSGKYGNKENEKIELAGIDIASTPEFFLWHTWFCDVFDKGGFDIIIANPPFIDSESMINQGMEELRDILKKKHTCLEGNWDIYMAFLEYSLSIANIVVFITPDKWLSKPFGKKFRGTRMKERMSSITRAGSRVFENATVDAIITLFTPNSEKVSVNVFESDNNNVKIAKKGDFSLKKIQDPFIIDYLFADNIDVITKMDSYIGKVKDLAECEGACATSDAYKLKPYINDIQFPDLSKYYKIINTGTISKYYNRWGLTPMKYLGHSYMYPVVDKKNFNVTFGSTYVKRASQPKVIFKGLNLLDVCLDEDAIVLPAKTTNVICSEDISLLKFLCGLLNSKLVFYYIKLKYSSSSYCGGITFTKDMINYLPININADKSCIIDIVNRILYLKKRNPQTDTSSLEHKIDLLVYDLYGLTPEEIAIVEGTNNE